VIPVNGTGEAPVIALNVPTLYGVPITKKEDNKDSNNFLTGKVTETLVTFAM